MFISDQLCSSHRLCPPFLFFLPPPQLANRSNLQRSPRGFFLSVLSGPRVGQSTRIIALRARARSDTCRGHRPPSCTLGQRLTTLSFHRFYKRNPPIIPHVICPTLTANLGILHLEQYQPMMLKWSVTWVHAVTKQQPLWLSLSLSFPQSRHALAFLSLFLYLSFDPSFDTIGRTTRIFTMGVSFLLFPLLLSLLYTRFENKDWMPGDRSNRSNSCRIGVGGMIGACFIRGQRVCNHGARSVAHD